MGLTEWFLLVVVVLIVPLAIAVVVTLWSLEQARQRTKRNRPQRAPGAVRRVALPDPVDEDSPGSAPSSDGQ